MTYGKTVGVTFMLLLRYTFSRLPLLAFAAVIACFTIGCSQDSARAPTPTTSSEPSESEVAERPSATCTLSVSGMT